jgi:hypothetical protein
MEIVTTLKNFASTILREDEKFFLAIRWNSRVAAPKIFSQATRDAISKHRVGKKCLRAIAFLLHAVGAVKAAHK